MAHAAIAPTGMDFLFPGANAGLDDPNLVGIQNADPVSGAYFSYDVDGSFTGSGACAAGYFHITPYPGSHHGDCDWSNAPGTGPTSESNSGWAGIFPVAHFHYEQLVVRDQCCEYDVDANGAVELNDVTVVTSCYFVPPVLGHACEPADVNCDGVIDSVDANCIFCEMATPGNPACCGAPNVSTQSPGVFCIDADGDGSDWSWQLDANAPVTVTGPVPSTAGDLRDAFRSSVNLAAIAGLSATPGPGAACFTVAYSSSFQFWVGPPGGPVTCLVTGNPLGCSFNPMIYEQAFLPVPLPALTTGGTIAAAAVVVLATLVLIRRRRAASARAH